MSVRTELPAAEVIGAVRDTPRKAWWLPFAWPIAALVLVALLLVLGFSAYGGGSSSKAPAAASASAGTGGDGTGSAGILGGLAGGSTVKAAPATGALEIVGGIGTVLFADGSDALTANARDVINAAATTVRATRPAKVTVTGYTDRVGDIPENSALSLQRAAVVAKALKAAVGPGPTVYATTARGENDPAATNATAAGRQLNRRATVTLG